MKEWLLNGYDNEDDFILFLCDYIDCIIISLLLAIVHDINLHKKVMNKKKQIKWEKKRMKNTMGLRNFPWAMKELGIVGWRW